jgi:hypothetical protein
MRKVNIYLYHGEAKLLFEGAGAMLQDFHIQDCYTKHVIAQKEYTLVGLYIKSGYVSIKSLFSHKTEKRDLAGEIVYVKEHTIDTMMSCNYIETDIPFFSWDTNRFKATISESGELLDVTYDEEILVKMFSDGFADALVNKPMKKLDGVFMIVYALGYNTCNKTDGAEVEQIPIIQKRLKISQ